MDQLTDNNMTAISKIKQLNIEHRNWNNALSESFAIISCAMEGEVVSIIGPSRAGKTKLIKALELLLTGEDKFEKTGLLPTITVLAENCDQYGTFSTKTFSENMLEELHHPLTSEVDFLSYDKAMMIKLDRLTERRLRKTIEKAIKYRQTKYIFIDEAQHARYTPKAMIGPQGVLDSWKSLAQKCKIILILVGAYPLLEIMHNSPHMLGRKFQIHFPRYQYNLEDLTAFEEIISIYSSYIKFKKNNSLRTYNELLYNGSMGCIGLLNAWLRRALAISTVRKKEIDKNILMETKLPDSDLEKMAEEIHKGEKLIDSNIPINKTSKENKKTQEKTKKKTKPFQKKPKRRTKGNRLKGRDDA